MELIRENRNLKTSLVNNENQKDSPFFQIPNLVEKDALIKELQLKTEYQD